MLTACPGCRHQYDVGSLIPGSKLHCHCGQLITVPEPKKVEVRAMHCSQCGGNLVAGAEACEYCGSQFSILEKRLGQACPECFARTIDGAHFCSTCGVELCPEEVDLTPLEVDCPRCEGPLVKRDVRNGNFTECTRCGGIWLADRTFEDLVERGDESTLARFLGRTPENEVDEVLKTAGQAPDHNRYIPCPECGQLMNRKNFARCSGVIIDWCKGHGYWFDTCELDKIVAFIRGGGLDQARKMQIQRRGKAMDVAGWGDTGARPAVPSLPSFTASEEASVDLLGVLASFARSLFTR